MARNQDQVQLIIELIGQDGVTRLLEDARNRAGDLRDNLEDAGDASEAFEGSVQAIGNSWAVVVTGLNQGLELFGKIGDAAADVSDIVKETARQRAVELRFVRELNTSVEAMSEAAGGLLDDVELKQFALQAKQAGLETEKFNQLLTVALKASTAQGKEFGEVFEGLFVDTVLGASDSYLEQLGIVVDLGTATEDYAKSNGIASDAINKNVQSAAALEVVLKDVGQRFNDVNTDTFITRLAAAENAVKGYQDEVNKAFTFATMDALEFVGAIKSSKSAFQVFKDAQREAEALAARMREIREVGDLSGHMFKELAKKTKANADAMLRMGEAARRDEIAMTQLFDAIAKDAQELTKLAGFMGDATAKATAYDAALVSLAEQYGLTDVAANRFTISAKEQARSLRDVKTVAEQTKTALESLERFMGGNRDSGALPDAPERDTTTQENVERLNREAGRAANGRRVRRRGGSRGRADAQAQWAYEQFRKGNEALRQMVKERRAELQEWANLEAETELMLVGVDRDILDMEAETARANAARERTREMEALADALRAASDMAIRTQEAFRMLGATDIGTGFANAMPHVEDMANKIRDLQEASNASTSDYVGNVSGIIAASGEIAGGFIQNEQAKAVIQGLVESANAAAAFARYDYVAGAMHTVAAGMYFGAAGASAATTGGGGGRGAGGGGVGGARSIPQFGQQAPQNNQQAASITVNMSGAIVAGSNRKKTAHELGELVAEGMGSRR